ncbi:MAG TPA: hypothetical protein VH419_14745 [Nocardioidaceae bacterium]
MFTSLESQRRIGRIAWYSAWVALVLGQLHALSRFATEDGKEDLDLPLTGAWAEPAGKALRPLLDWAGPDTVYLTYGKVWFPLFLAFTLCAFVVRRRRQAVGFEKWAWRVALLGYVWGAVGTFCDYWTQWADPNAFFDIAFVITIPGLLLTMIGSTMLGTALLRNGFRPKVSAWLLTAAVPGLLLISEVTSLGNTALPIMFAFGIVGRRIAREPSYAVDVSSTSLLVEHA